MTEEVFDAVPAPAETGPQWPGQLLRETREAMGLSIAEVASSIKFHPRQIEALERDDYDQLQGKTFLRGFVRAYARILQMPSEPLLDMLERQQVFHEEVVVPPGNMGETNPRPFYRRHVRGLLATIVVLFVAGGLGWAFLDADLQSFARKPASVVTEKPTSTEHDVAVNPVAVSDGSSGPVAGSDGLSGTAANPAEAAVQPDTMTVPGAPATTLAFEFSGLSWLEVKDGSGRILITGEFPAGQKHGVDGKPPYDLWIGKASAVKVLYKGQPVDVMPYAHDEVARLTLN